VRWEGEFCGLDDIDVANAVGVLVEEFHKIANFGEDLLQIADFSNPFCAARLLLALRQRY
jgi:hypothetical protein